MCVAGIRIATAWVADIFIRARTSLTPLRVDTFACYNRGVFTTMTSRRYGAKNAIPSSRIVSEMKPSNEEVAEIEYCFAGLKPYLKQS